MTSNEIKLNNFANVAVNVRVVLTTQLRTRIWFYKLLMKPWLWVAYKVLGVVVEFDEWLPRDDTAM